MKNYCLDENEESKFIVEVYENEKNGTLSVKFADGRIFKHIVACDENIEKIIAVQEEQAKNGIENYQTFKQNERSSKIGTAVTGLGLLSAGVASSFIPVIQDSITSQNPVLVYAGIGAVAVLGTIPAYAVLKRKRAVVKELDKLRYRDEHREELEQFRNYPNALAGVNPSVASWMKGEEDPFCILSIDSYSLDDLEKIVSNIQIEKSFDFTYRRR